MEKTFAKVNHDRADQSNAHREETMKHKFRWFAVGLLIACLQLVACGRAPAISEKTVHARIEHLEGAEPTRVTLTADAAKRLDIQTVAVRDAQVNGAQRKVIPYAAILYDTQGKTWTYITTQPLTYIRHPVTVDSIAGDEAVLSDGPPSGMAVVAVGAEELYGSETEFKEE
jgi:hypothetical protein